MSIQANATIPLGQNAYWMTTAPPGITINRAWTANGDVNAGGWTTGVVVGDFWRDVNTGAWGGSTLAQGQHWFNTGLEGSSNINSQIYGIQLVCTQNNWAFGGCGFATPPWFTVSGIELQGTENSLPSVTGQGALWGSGSYVWNPPGDPFPVALYGSDVSGICASEATVSTHQLNGPPEPRDSTVWQQCPNPVSWSFSVDTRSEVPTDGYFKIDLNATNAAGVVATAPKTVWVDNDPVGVSFRTSNDPNPTVWVNHAVTVNATPSAGPSGVGGMNCAVDRASATSYPASGVTIDGDGVHTVSCTAWNRAVGPQGQPNTGGNSITIKIDEAPPAIAFEPPNPSDPTALVVDTSDSESGVADGSIEMAPAGTNDWTTLPTTFDGARLLAHFDDAGRHGPYTFQVTSCDNVGNCATSSEQLALPMRIASDSQVSLAKIVNPLRKRVVHKRVRVGWRWVTVRRGGKLFRVKRGGHFKTIKVVEYVERCSTKRVRTATHRWQVKRVCKRPHVHLTTTLRVPYGHKITIHGLDTTSQGVPLAGQPVHILGAPDNQSGAFSQLATVTAAANGSWTATLPPGPSRIIRAATDGTPTVLPSSGQVTTIVPARIEIKITPTVVPWGSDAPHNWPSARRVRAHQLKPPAAQRRDRADRPTRGPAQDRARRTIRDRVEIQSRPRRAAPLVQRRHALGIGVPLRPRHEQAQSSSLSASAPRRTARRHHRPARPAPPAAAKKATGAAMIARHRGDERIHSRWHPPAASSATPAQWNPQPDGLLDPDPPRTPGPRSAGGRTRGDRTC